MQRRKVVKKNESKYRTIKNPARGSVKIADVKKVAKAIKTKKVKSNPPIREVLYFFNKALLHKAFKNIAEEKEIPIGKLIISFASLGLKAYLKSTGQAFKEDAIETKI